MHVILCLDDRDGMLFNHRRQSRDRTVLEDIFQNLEERQLLIRPFSLSLFREYGDQVQMEEALLENAGPEDCCFVEDLPLAPWKDKIQSITVYRWNRHYPADVSLDLNLKSEWRLVSRRDFPGHSHETITKEVYQP